jgi:hypothetical protein
MDADLDLLLIAVYCTVDDLLPKRQRNARRRITDAEVITLSLAQAVMGIPSDPRFLAVASKRLSHLFPEPAGADCVSQAPAATVGCDRGPDQRVRQA